MSGFYDDGAAALARARERSARAADFGLDWLPIGEASERIGVSVVTLRKAIERGEIQCVRSVDTAYTERLDPEAVMRWARRIRLIA